MCLEDEEALGLELSSRKKSRTLLKRQFLPFCEARKFVHLDQVLPIDLTEFRSTWNNGEATTHRKHERMHSFFAFCAANDMLRKNPMDALKKPKTPDIVPTDYFLPKEFEQIDEVVLVGLHEGLHKLSGHQPDIVALLSQCAPEKVRS